MMDDPWLQLDHELDAWRREARTPTLWLRDDDATRPGPALDRLLHLVARRGVPLALAVVPAGMEPELVSVLDRHPGVWVLQHGFAHVDHAAREEPGAELGEHRPGEAVLDELERGRLLLAERFARRFLPVLVPPWNRIAAPLLPGLGPLGFRGLSCFSPRTRRWVADGVVSSNCHVDPVNWRAGGVFRGEGKSLAALVAHLRARRLGEVDAAEPTGLLTHHACHDEALWRFLERLLERLDGDRRLRWLDAPRVFAP